jgi:hypothetical protein
MPVADKQGDELQIRFMQGRYLPGMPGLSVRGSLPFSRSAGRRDNPFEIPARYIGRESRE